MPGTAAQYGDMMTLNHIAGLSVPVVAASAPTWHPGIYWVDTSDSNAIYDWNGTAWVKSPAAGTRYLALLTADPATSASGGTAAVNISDLIEDTTSGYGRQTITFGYASAAAPSALSNTADITFGPYTANQAAPVQWAAMVTVQTGTTGLLLFTWDLDTVEQVASSQNIKIPAGFLTLGQG